jgi:hypothetical protein
MAAADVTKPNKGRDDKKRNPPAMMAPPSMIGNARTRLLPIRQARQSFPDVRGLRVPPFTPTVALEPDGFDGWEEAEDVAVWNGNQENLHIFFVY